MRRRRHHRVDGWIRQQQTSEVNPLVAEAQAGARSEICAGARAADEDPIDTEVTRPTQRSLLNNKPGTVELQPDFGAGQLYLAKALLDAGDLTGAEHWARSGLASRTDRDLLPLGHFVLADVYNRSGRTAEANREVAAARRLGAK